MSGEDASPASSSQIVVHQDDGGRQQRRQQVDRRSRRRPKWLAREWDRGYIVACAAGLIVDPLFLYAVSISGPLMVVFLDGYFAAGVTALRTAVDVVLVWHMLLRLRAAVGVRRRGADDQEKGGGGEETSTSGAVGERSYLKSKNGLLLDVAVVLPVMQCVVWVAAPAMLLGDSPATTVMTVFLVAFLAEYLPKIYHSVCFLRRSQSFSGYLSGTVWWGIALNLTAYFIAAHAVGACWYLLGTQRATKCLTEQCGGARCPPGAPASAARTACLAGDTNYSYGAYKWTVGLVANPNRAEKILLPIFWGLMTLSTFGNLESTTEWLEIVFNIVTITGGLLLVTMLIGNIKVFLSATTSKKQAMQLRLRGVEWWMKRKALPQGFRQRVRQFERQRWAATRGVDEGEMIGNLPEGLRRDIKYHLCLDLVRQVPLFQHMDELVLENICDRVKSLIFPIGETIIREGDPVQRMLFIVRGHLQSSQVLRDGVTSRCMLGPGNFSGDELLSWCMRRPFVERLPPSSYTLVTLESTEAFGLDAGDVKYVTQHFRHTFANEKVRRSARYYSPSWRTWAAVAIQLAWRRWKQRRTAMGSLSFARPRRPHERCSSAGEEKVRLYAALLASPKPNQDEFLM